jgi:hypothetical protein
VARDSKSFGRKPARYKPQPRVLVLCEDSKSSLLYLREAAQHFRVLAQIEISHPGKTDPKGIVNEAVKRRSSLERVFCVIDRDAHQGFDEALQMATAGEVDTIVSYPCYEFWLLLHFRYTRAGYVAGGVHSAADHVVQHVRAEAGMQDYAKGSSAGLFERLLERLPAACQRAEQSLQAAVVEDEPNPSTEMHRLIDAFKQLAELQPI